MRNKYILPVLLIMSLAIPSAIGKEFTVNQITYSILSTEPPTVEVTDIRQNETDVVVIPETVKPMEGSGLTDEDYKVVSVKESAISRYSSFSTLVLPKSIEKLASVLGYSSRWTETIVDEENPYFKTVDGIVYNHALDTLIVCPTAKTVFEPLPPSLRVIGD